MTMEMGKGNMVILKDIEKLDSTKHWDWLHVEFEDKNLK